MLRCARRFSALQRAENSSMFMQPIANDVLATFQCSSASRKFLNRGGVSAVGVCARGFSALQRAENSSISSAFANICTTVCFSALQRAENSSIGWRAVHNGKDVSVSVLFSEPKIPQFNIQKPLIDLHRIVSVLFSEPKIPQYTLADSAYKAYLEVSVLFSEPKIPQLFSSRSSSVFR